MTYRIDQTVDTVDAAWNRNVAVLVTRLVVSRRVTQRILFVQRCVQVVIAVLALVLVVGGGLLWTFKWSWLAIAPALWLSVTAYAIRLLLVAIVNRIGAPRKLRKALNHCYDSINQEVESLDIPLDVFGGLRLLWRIRRGESGIVTEINRYEAAAVKIIKALDDADRHAEAESVDLWLHPGEVRDFDMPSRKPTLADGVILLRPLDEADAVAHFAGEDDDQVRWLSGGKATLDGVRKWVAENAEQWRSGGPRCNFGVFDAQTDELIGNAEANLGLESLMPGEANLSYVVFPQWRGRGVAVRCVALLCQWLTEETDSTVAVIRVDKGNLHSHRVPVDAGFKVVGPIVTPDGDEMVRYERSLNGP